MKTISTDLKNHLAQEVTTIATCWTITREDGEVYRFTDHDCDFEVGGELYEAESSMVPTGIKQDRTLTADNLEIMAFLDSTRIVRADVVAGKFDRASMDVFLVNWVDPTMGVLYLAQGWTLGRTEIRDTTCNVEVRGPSHFFGQEICDLYSETCRVELGSSACGVNLASSGRTQTGEVTDVTNRQRFEASGLTPGAGFFTGGLLTWTNTDSDNYGLSMEILSVENISPGDDVVTLLLPMPADVVSGDTFSAVVGCDKTIGRCDAFFDNAHNFRGEPFLPVAREVHTSPRITPGDRTPWAS